MNHDTTTTSRSEASGTRVTIVTSDNGAAPLAPADSLDAARPKFRWSKGPIRSNLFQQLSTVTDADAQLVRDIAKDVPRSFGGLDAPLEERTALADVLLAFSKYEGGEGYTQGMGFIAAFALQQQRSHDSIAKENAFWLMVRAAKDLPSGFFYRAAQDEVLVFKAIVSKYLPEVEAHLGDELFAAVCYLIPRWFLSLFVFRMPEKVTLRLWDDVFFETRADEVLSYRFMLVYRLHCVALALLTLHAPNLLKQARIADQALDRISNRHSGSAIEAELLNHRDTRVGLEFMQFIVEATLEDDTNSTKLIDMVKSTPLSLDSFKEIRCTSVTHLIEFQRTLRLVLRIQRWYRTMRAERARMEASRWRGHAPHIGFDVMCCGGARSHRRASQSCELQ